MNDDRATHHRQIIEAMARALDADDFVAARALLATDSVYETGRETHHGPEAIIASYAGATAWARRAFDEVRYESETGPAAGTTASVTFTDYVLKAGHRWHRHRCRQEFTVGEDGRIARIVHHELPGEREAVEAYLKECGIER